jgi:hypothetical protein
MELFALKSIMGLELSEWTSREKVKRRLATATSTSCLGGERDDNDTGRRRLPSPRFVLP